MMSSRSLSVSLIAGVLFTQCLGWSREPNPERRISVAPGQSVVVDTADEIRRLAVSNPAVAEVLVVSSKEVLVNGVGPGQTTLLVWPKEGDRVVYNVVVENAASAVEAIRGQLAREFPNQDVSIEMENGTVFLRGTMKDPTSAERALTMAGTLGKIVNLLFVEVPPADAQILLKVRFANVDRTASTQLGANLVSTGATNTPGSISTGQFGSPQVKLDAARNATFSLTDALNLFLFRPDLNLGATIRALQSRNLLEILAEPNVLTMDNKEASFVAGGQFPFPSVQGGANAGAVTVSFREFGIKINFLPNVTPRGTIRLHVTPEVSSLDFANGLIFQGFTIPAISTRRVDTQVELESGQSFAIAGLLDNRTTETLSKIPGIGDIPVLGKMFQSRNVARSNSELLIIVTPELVRPIPGDKVIPQLSLPKPFMEGVSPVPPQTPGADVTGPVEPLARPRAVPYAPERAVPNAPSAGNAAAPQMTRGAEGPGK
jgi:pilus assembly protein CpaC